MIISHHDHCQCPIVYGHAHEIVSTIVSDLMRKRRNGISFITVWEGNRNII